MKKRILVFLLAFVMLFGIMPSLASAADDSCRYKDCYGCWKDSDWCWYGRYNDSKFGYWDSDGNWHWYDWYYNNDYGYWKDGNWYWYDRYNNDDFGYWKDGSWHWYNWYYNDKYGCWKDGGWCWYDRYNDDDFGYWRDGKWYWYDWYYNDDYGYWKDGNWYWYNRYNDDGYGYWRDGKWYWYDKYIYSPTATEAKKGTSYVTGYGAGPYALVFVTDFNDNLLGSATAKSDGSFYVTTSRSLVGGETLKIKTSYRNKNDSYSTITVSGVREATNSYNYKNVFTIGSKNYTQNLNGIKIEKTMDTVPYLKNGRTMLPIRYIAESLGYEVTYDHTTKNAVFIKGDSAVIINWKSRDFKVNKTNHTFSVDPITVDGRIMLPVSEIATALGLSHGNLGEGKAIEWDAANNQVIIQINK